VWNDPATTPICSRWRPASRCATNRASTSSARTKPSSGPPRPGDPPLTLDEISNVLAPLGVDMAKVAADVASRRPTT